MKTKDKQRKNIFFKYRAICLLPILIVSLICFPLISSASTSSVDYIAENHEHIEAHISDIGEEISKYAKLDTTPTKAISSAVSEVINEYRQALMELEAHKDISKRSMEAEIDRAYARSVSAGRLAWIYFYNIKDVTSQASINAIKSVYDNALTSIKEDASADTITNLCSDLCSNLNRVAYAERIKSLIREEDSATCLGYVDIAVRSLETINCSDLWGTEFAIVLEDTKTKLKLQRARDYLYSQIVDIFPIIRPDEAFDRNYQIGVFNIELTSAKSLSEMNEATRKLIRELTAISESKKYTYAFISELNIMVNEVSLKATSSDIAGDFAALFKDYTKSYQRVCSKDEIYSLLFADGKDSELERLEQFFNAKGGLLDKCESSYQMNAEIQRAIYKKRLYYSVRDTLSDLSIIIGSYDGTAFKNRVNECYSTASSALDILSNTLEQFEENCNKALEKANSELLGILQESKAQRYLLDHSQIIKKPKNELSVNDEIALRIAITDYLKLEADVRAVISSQISSVSGKYKTVLSLLICSLRADDSFYLDICESIIDELKALPTEDISVFYSSCNSIMQKAEALEEAVSYYRQLCSSELYKVYSDQEKNELSSVCKNFSKALCTLGLNATQGYREQLDALLRDAIAELDRIDQAVRVRVATRESENVNILNILSDARVSIFLCSSRTEMVAVADKAIFKINRLLTIDTIISQSDECSTAIEKMDFLTKDEKSTFSSRSENLKKALCEEATLAENITVLSFIWNSFTEELDNIRREANQTDLKKGREEYSQLITNDTQSLEKEINAMAHLSAERKKELLNSAIALATKFSSDIQSCESSDSVAQKYSDTLEQFNSLKLAATSENLKNYKEIVLAEIDNLCPDKKNYSENNYTEILELIQRAKEKLSSCISIGECSSLVESTRKNIEGINDLLQDTKDAALISLNEALSICTDNPSLYSQQNIALAKQLYANAEKAINAYQKISDIPSLKEKLNESLELIRAVRRDSLYTSNQTSSITEPKAEYPIGYDFDNGYWGKIYSKDGILPSASLSIFGLDSNDNLKELQKLIRKAAKKQELIIYGDISREKLNLIKKCAISLGLDISLSESADNVKNYTLQMLLPQSLKNENVLAIAFVDKNGNVELYSIEQKDMLVSLDVSHFSKYYILCEETVDLTPLLIFLIILLVFEIIVFCFVLFLRYNRRRKEKNMLPESFFYSLNPFLAYSALKIKPDNAVELAILLSVAALALGCGIAFLAKTELSFLKKLKSQTGDVNSPSEENSLTNEEPSLLNSISHEPLPEAKEVPVLCTGTANEDGDVQAFVLRDDIPSENEATSEAEEIRHTAHRVEINLDVIADKFRDGELVTIDALKKKRLISKKANYVKILARGTLSKPLIIEANDFSHAAEEMLSAIGGEAIRVNNK